MFGESIRRLRIYRMAAWTLVSIGVVALASLALPACQDGVRAPTAAPAPDAEMTSSAEADQANPQSLTTEEYDAALEALSFKVIIGLAEASGIDWRRHARTLIEVASKRGNDEIASRYERMLEFDPTQPIPGESVLRNDPKVLDAIGAMEGAVESEKLRNLQNDAQRRNRESLGRDPNPPLLGWNRSAHGSLLSVSAYSLVLAQTGDDCIDACHDFAHGEASGSASLEYLFCLWSIGIYDIYVCWVFGICDSCDGVYNAVYNAVYSDEFSSCIAGC